MVAGGSWSLPRSYPKLRKACVTMATETDLAAAVVGDVVAAVDLATTEGEEVEEEEVSDRNAASARLLSNRGPTFGLVVTVVCSLG